MDEKKLKKVRAFFINKMFIRVYCLFFLIGYESVVGIGSVSNKIFIHWSGVSLEKKQPCGFLEPQFLNLTFTQKKK